MERTWKRKTRIGGSASRRSWRRASGSKTQTITWEDAINAFLGELRVEGLRERTIDIHRVNLEMTRDHLGELGIQAGPADVTADNLKQVMVLMREKKGLSPRTVNLRRNTWLRFFAFLHDQGYREDNPAKGIKKHQEDTKVIQALMDHEVEALLAQPDLNTFVGLRNYVILLLFLDTGMRLGELINLEVSDIDLSSRTIHLRQTKTHSGRTVYFSERTGTWLRRYLTERAESREPRLFISWDNKPLDRNTVQGQLRMYGKMAGISRKVSPHVLRHTFARLYIMQGGDQFSLQKILGHRTTEMTSRYVDLFLGDIKKQHERFSPIAHLKRDRR